ncbi:MAG: 30S ribosomal protein S18 [Clostridia bacterium]|nr:30S ribosomal protein S18 [Clostridia bacterium]
MKRDNKPSFKRNTKKKVCPFCEKNIVDIDYIVLFKNADKAEKSYDRNSGERRARYVSESGKIMPRRTTGVCVRHQVDLASAVKRARIMALLPFKGE